MTGIPSQYYLLGNALRNAEQNHRVVSQNIANVNTPGYQTRELSFEDYMKRVKSGESNQGFIDEIPTTLVEGLVERVDGNNVDFDQQVANLKKNALLFQSWSQLLAAKMSTMRKAMTG
ncbi:flagellar basal body rod protein FlgB [Mariniblastus fucicola]|uniref:Flagellar basal body rod protein FlgB n=1 Tax=Mariniblastus fucicola TaxID=980251 RepID=A0A5B9PDU7_9BACT|nr:flagellar basal body protein [Mariniblastus fucicola]QEG23375.1 Flagellar basal body rod protein FlgB [Mariniblastus fucicola]